MNKPRRIIQISLLATIFCHSTFAISTSRPTSDVDVSTGDSAPHRPVCIRELPKPAGVWRPRVNHASIGYVQFGIALSSDVFRCDDQRRVWVSLNDFPGEPYLLAVALDTFVKRMEENTASWDDRISAEARACVMQDTSRIFGGFFDLWLDDFEENVEEAPTRNGSRGIMLRKNEISFAFTSCEGVYVAFVEASRHADSARVFIEPKVMPPDIRICDDGSCEDNTQEH